MMSHDLAQFPSLRAIRSAVRRARTRTARCSGEPSFPFEVERGVHIVESPTIDWPAVEWPYLVGRCRYNGGCLQLICIDQDFRFGRALNADAIADGAFRRAAFEAIRARHLPQSSEETILHVVAIRTSPPVPSEVLYFPDPSDECDGVEEAWCGGGNGSCVRLHHELRDILMNAFRLVQTELN